MTEKCDGGIAVVINIRNINQRVIRYGWVGRKDGIGSFCVADISPPFDSNCRAGHAIAVDLSVRPRQDAFRAVDQQRNGIVGAGAFDAVMNQFVALQSANGVEFLDGPIVPAGVNSADRAEIKSEWQSCKPANPIIDLALAELSHGCSVLGFPFG